MNDPRRIKAKIVRVVEEIALIELEKDGTVREYIEQHDELDTVDVLEVRSIIEVYSYWGG